MSKVSKGKMTGQSRNARAASSRANRRAQEDSGGARVTNAQRRAARIRGASDDVPF